MTKDGLPESVLKFTSCNCKTNCKTKSCGCKKVNLKCTLYCGCAKNDDVMCCMNAPDSSDEDDVDQKMKLNIKDLTLSRIWKKNVLCIKVNKDYTI